jgi:hypothetical protein
MLVTTKVYSLGLMSVFVDESSYDQGDGGRPTAVRVGNAVSA